jgi:hypothetical protein
VCSRAWSSGPSSAALARIASSQVRDAGCRVTALMMIAQIASRTISPVHSQVSASTVSGDAASGTRASVVWAIPVR